MWRSPYLIAVAWFLVLEQLAAVVVGKDPPVAQSTWLDATFSLLIATYSSSPKVSTLDVGVEYPRGGRKRKKGRRIKLRIEYIHQTSFQSVDFPLDLFVSRCPPPYFSLPLVLPRIYIIGVQNIPVADTLTSHSARFLSTVEPWCHPVGVVNLKLLPAPSLFDPKPPF